MGLGCCYSTIFDVALGDINPDEAGSASGSLSSIQQLAAGIDRPRSPRYSSKPRPPVWPTHESHPHRRPGRHRPQPAGRRTHAPQGTARTAPLIWISGCSDPEHIVGISKTHTCWQQPRCFDWKHDLQRASTNSGPPHPVAGVLAILGRPSNGNHNLWMWAGRGRLVRRDGSSLRRHANYHRGAAIRSKY